MVHSINYAKIHYLIQNIIWLSCLKLKSWGFCIWNNISTSRRFSRISTKTRSLIPFWNGNEREMIVSSVIERMTYHNTILQIWMWLVLSSDLNMQTISFIKGFFYLNCGHLHYIKTTSHWSAIYFAVYFFLSTRQKQRNLG